MKKKQIYIAIGIIIILIAVAVFAATPAGQFILRPPKAITGEAKGCENVVCQQISRTCPDGFVAYCTPQCYINYVNGTPAPTCGTCTPDCSGHMNFCTDSDGGRVYDVRGSVSGIHQNGTSFNYTDGCSTSINLVEYYCSGALPLNENKNCQTLGYAGCTNGACYGTNQTNQTNNPPFITSLSHSPNGTITNTTLVTIYTAATDDIDLATISIFVDAILKKTCSFTGGSDTSGTCSYNSTYARGEHSYYSRAVDSQDQLTQSAMKTFNVTAG